MTSREDFEKVADAMTDLPETRLSASPVRPMARRRRWVLPAFLAGAILGVVVGYLVLDRLGFVPTVRRNVSRTGSLPPTTAPDRSWAAPLSAPGLPNFHRVSETLYRGARPQADGYRQLKALGIKTIVNLESFHRESDEAAEAGLGYEHIYMKAWHPEDKELVWFLQIVTDPARTPVFVHCQHGSDRTGTMCAIYRIAVQGWTQGGFGFHELWQNLPEYINSLDLGALRRQAGLPPAP